MKEIPFFDLKRQNKKIRKDIDQAIGAVIDSTSFILGKELEDFEKSFASFTGVGYAAGVSSGLEALVLALKALGVGDGDEVLVPAHTFIATALAVSLAGARPVLVDVDPIYFLMDAAKAKQALTKKTKAIMPVHIYGQPAFMGEILKLAKDNNLFVIEDAAQAHGASIDGKVCGSFGDMGCFSFYPSKNLGAFGDGGMITTNNKELYEKILYLRNYGSKTKYYHDTKGSNCRLDNMQAAILSVKLKHLKSWNEKRRSLTALYNSHLKKADGVQLPSGRPGFYEVCHLYVILHENRDQLKKYLDAKGIHTNIHYPVPIHLQKAYKELGYPEGAFPVAEQISNKCLSLPFFPEMTESEVRAVCQAIKDFPRE